MAQEEIQETQEEEERSDNGETPTQASENEKPMGDAPEKTEETPPAEEENNEAPEQQGESGDEEGEEETFGIKLETAPNDIRFPTTNQSRHCFTRYIEYHRCIAVKGEGAIECQKFAKYYRSLCPGEWIEAWNEQREQGIFPGPL